jgi:AraC-like DNA-binding protein
VDESEAHAILNNRAVIESRLPDALLLPQEFDPSNAKAFQEMFHDLIFEQENPSFTVEKFQILFRLMMIRINEMVISEHIADERIPKSHAVKYAIIQQVFENLTDVDFSVRSLADRLQYDPHYLERLFKSVMCKSIEEYLIDRRIQYSVNQLIDTGETIERIAFESGFGSKRNFLRQFTNRKQITSSQLRLRYRMMHITNR